MAEELQATAPEVFLADVETLLRGGVANFGIDVTALSAADRAGLVAMLAAVHMAIDHEDLTYARDLFESRRNAGLDSIVGELVENSAVISELPAKRLPR